MNTTEPRFVPLVGASERLGELAAPPAKMVTVWKYVIPSVHEPASFDMPTGAHILRVALQGESVCLWARVDTGAPMESRQFSVWGTGHPIPPDAEYRGTVDHYGGFVWHVFEVYS